MRLNCKIRHFKKVNCTLIVLSEANKLSPTVQLDFISWTLDVSDQQNDHFLRPSHSLKSSQSYTIDLCVENPFKDRTHVENLPKNSFPELLNHWSYLIRDSTNIIMELQWVLAPLGPTFSNVFLCYHGKIWLQNCSSKFKPVIYKK